MDRRRRRTVFCLWRRETHGQRCRRRAAQDRAGTRRQIGGRRERLRREAQNRQALQARRVLRNDEVRMTNDEQLISSFGFRHSFVIKHSSFVIFLGCLLLVAQVACAGLEKYSSLVVADKSPDTSAPPDTVRITYLGVNGFQFETDGHAL